MSAHEPTRCDTCGVYANGAPRCLSCYQMLNYERRVREEAQGECLAEGTIHDCGVRPPSVLRPVVTRQTVAETPVISVDRDWGRSGCRSELAGDDGV